MDSVDIPGFPNCMPSVDCKTYFPKFRDQKGRDVAIQLVKFHMHVRRLKVQFHEDFLMKMFKATLEEKVRYWYEILPNGCLYSLRYFHVVSYERYKENHPSLLLV